MQKTGYKTTEFCVSVVTILALAIGSVAGSLPGKYASIGAAIAAGLYALARGFSKQNLPPPEK